MSEERRSERCAARAVKYCRDERYHICGRQSGHDGPHTCAWCGVGFGGDFSVQPAGLTGRGHASATA